MRHDVSTSRCLRRLTLLIAVASASGARAEVLLDQMYMVWEYQYDRKYGNAIGGEYLGNGECFAVQICDDFSTTQTGHIITEVEVGNLFMEAHHDVDDVRISIYADLGGLPSEEPVYSKRVSEITRRSPIAPLGIVNTDFYDDVDRRYFGVVTKVTGLYIPLEPETSYFICVQVDSGEKDWAYTCVDRDNLPGNDSFVRDGPTEEGCTGQGWFFTDWRSIGSIQDPASSAYRIVAVGGPCPAPGDFDRDGEVTSGDLAAFIRAWSMGDADEDGDGTTDAADLAGFVQQWTRRFQPVPDDRKH